MRLRQPTQELPEECKNISPTESFKKTFQVELITPLYGGGVKAGVPDEKMPIRATAIRGQLRFWWRLLNRGKKFEDERKIWGGISEGVATASRVIIRLKDMPKVDKKSCTKYQQENKQHWQQGVGYALGIQDDPDNTFLLDPKANKKISFKLELCITAGRDKAQDIWEQEVLQPLRWWASFGGLGARTRRGLGSVKVMDLEPIGENEVAKVDDCQLVALQKGNDAIEAWKTAVGKLQHFRQGGRYRWPEADSIRKITKCPLPKHETPVPRAAIPSFPRAVFGLPIITHFSNSSKPVDTTLKPKEKDRMASPLILKAMWVNGENYQSIALLLPYDNHINLQEIGLELIETEGNKLLKDMPTTDTWWSTTHRDAMNNDQNNPLSGQTGDVLKDFLTFFQEGK